MIDLIADRVDLAIDLLTLGQYGLEPEGPRDRDAASSSPHAPLAASAPASMPRDPWGWSEAAGSSWSGCGRSRQLVGRARRVACERPRSSTSSAGCQ